MKNTAFLRQYEKVPAGQLHSPVYLKVTKRSFDLVLAILLIPMLIPVIAILWCLVRLDGGPGFFGQERVGRNGQRFTFWKLRTMRVDGDRILEEECDRNAALASEWNTMQKLRKDPRVTPLGEVLRKTSLDELPQIFNVLKGDMSFVGPRPFMVEQEKIYVDGGGEAYYKLRPGITGLWQVSGRGETTFLERVRYDNAYFENVSFRYDIWILLRTAFVVFKGS